MSLDLAPVLAVLAALLLSFGGFAALACGMNRHYAQFSASPRTPNSIVLSRVMGALLLGAGLIACIAGWGVSVGIIGWGCVLSVAAMAVIFSLSYIPRAIRAIALCAPLAGLAIAIAGLVA